MSVAAASPVPGAGGADLHVATVCAMCGEAVTRVRTRVPGKWVELDGKDPAGEWWAVRVSGRWRMVRPEVGEDPPVSGVRYREHGCEFVRASRVVAGMVASVPVRARSGAVMQVASDTAVGPCAGGCGARVVRYGSGACGSLCVDCGGVLAAWRASPGPRGAVVFGRWVGDEYRLDLCGIPETGSL